MENPATTQQQQRKKKGQKTQRSSSQKVKQRMRTMARRCHDCGTVGLRASKGWWVPLLWLPPLPPLPALFS